MTKKTKRPHKEDLKNDTPTTSNRKKIDDKSTPTKTIPDSKDKEMSEIAPKALIFNEDNHKTAESYPNTTKKIIHNGFTSTEWCASGLRCKNDKISAKLAKPFQTCFLCKLSAHPECLCDNECLTCNKDTLWNSYTGRWVKVIPSSIPNTKDSSLQKASQEISDNQSTNLIFGDKQWCGAKELCRNQNTPANDKNTCTICLDHIHSECINAGEQESEYICLGCNKKPSIYSDDDRLESITTQQNTAIISEGTNQTSSNTLLDSILPTSTAQTTEEMDIELLATIPDHEKCLPIINEEQTTQGQKTHKKYPIAPGPLRITTNPDNNNRIRPNKSIKKGEFFITRVELRVNIHSNSDTENNLKKLHRHLVDILNTLNESDATLKVIPWKEQQEYAEVDGSNIPDNQPGIKKFFNRITPRQEGNTYADMRIKHTRKFDDIINDIDLWLSNHQHGIYFQTLQCEETTNIGWLLWSFRRLDTRKLEDEIWELYKINIALKYQNIALSTNRGDTANTDIVKALHIWTKKSEADSATRLFNKDVYSKTVDHFPLGIVMRFMPHIGRITDPSRFDKFRETRSKQQTFLNGIENERNLSATSWEILSLEQKKGPYESLRKIIMGIESKRTKGVHLFLSVDCSFFRRNEILFSFLPRHENEAREFVANLVPYILNTHPDVAARSFFHPDAVERALLSEWDNDQQAVISFIDKYLDDFEILDDYGDDPDTLTLNMDCTALQTSHMANAMSKVEKLIMGEENDSIGTLLTSATSTHVITGTIPSSINGSTSDNTIIHSSQSTLGKSVATTMSQEQIVSNIVNLNKGMSILYLIAKQLNIEVDDEDPKTSPGDNQITEATSSNADGGCKEK
jgi:hypothetical protein